MIYEEIEEGKEAEIVNPDEIEERENEDGIWNLKTNTIPKGMVDLEWIFDNDEFSKQRRPSLDVGNDDYNLFNLDFEGDPWMVKIGRVYTEQEKNEMLQLLTQYKDVIAWSYQDLKTYDPNIIVHDIPLKPDPKPFHQR